MTFDHTTLLQYCHDGDLNAVQEAFAVPQDPSFCMEALRCAIYGNQRDIIEFLLPHCVITDSKIVMSWLSIADYKIFSLFY